MLSSEILIKIIASVILGLLPQVFFCYNIIKFSKGANYKNFIHILGIMVLFNFQIRTLENTVIAILLIIFSFWFLSKKVFIFDLTVFMFTYTMLFLLDGVCYFLNDNYWIGYSVNLVTILTLPFIFKTNIKRCYNYFLTRWNKTENKGLKSITIRNISVVTVNVGLIILNFYIKLQQ